MKPVFSNSQGLNNLDHPAKMANEYGEYQSKLVNADVTDSGTLRRRCGAAVLLPETGHSLVALADRFLVFVADCNLVYVDVTDESYAVNTLAPLSGNKVSYSEVGEYTVYTDGVTMGRLSVGSSGVNSSDYFGPEVPEEYLALSPAPFPIVDELHPFYGAMYGIVIGGDFVYYSLPFLFGAYVPSECYFRAQGKTNWVSSVGKALLVGCDNGIQAFVGVSPQTFTERRLTSVKTIACSSISRMTTKDGPEIQGIFALTNSGIIFIDENLSVVDETTKLDVDWSSLASASLSVINNELIFIGETL